MSKKTTTDALDTAIANVQAVREVFKRAFLEREESNDLLLTQLIAREHGLILGPPGTGKSLSINVLAEIMDAKYFRRLITRNTDPSELYGSVSFTAFKQDRYMRNVKGKMPEAEVVLLDEIFKGNSAINNSNLTIMEERLYDNDGTPISCPLISLFAASNELPESEELAALWDRFGLKLWVNYCDDRENRITLIRGHKPRQIVRDAKLKFTKADLAVLADACEKMAESIDYDLAALIEQIAKRCTGAGIAVSDRALARIGKVLAAYALVQGDKEICEDHLFVLEQSFWTKPEQVRDIREIVAEVANPIKAAALEIYDGAKERFDNYPQQGPDDKFMGGPDAVATAEDINTALKKAQEKLEKLIEDAPTARAEFVQDLKKKIRRMHRDVSMRYAKHTGMALNLLADDDDE